MSTPPRPKMVLNQLGEESQKRASKKDLLSKAVEELQQQDVELDQLIQELGLGNFLKKAVKTVGKAAKEVGNVVKEVAEAPATVVRRAVGGKGGRERDFDENKHSRGPDGRFKKGSAATKEWPVEPTYSGSLKGEGVSGKVGRKITKTDAFGKKVDGISVEGSVYRTTTKSGTKLALYDDDSNNMSEKKKIEMLSTLADLQELYPKKFKTRYILLKNAEYTEKLNGGRKGIIAWMAPRSLPRMGSDTRINVNADNSYFDEGFDYKGVDKDGYSHDGDYMPSANKYNFSSYVLSHEFGHQYDSQENRSRIGLSFVGEATRGLASNNNILGDMSIYGSQYGHAETYAEAFAEWHMSRGKTRNPAAIAFARHEGWYGAANALISAGWASLGYNTEEEGALVGFDVDTPQIDEIDHSKEDSVDNLGPGEYIIADTFDVKMGPYLIGDVPKDEEPTSEEKQLAEAIIRQVYEELGL